MQQVWMQRVKVKCFECECWVITNPEGDRGECHRNSPIPFGTYGQGVWPETKTMDFCYEGIKKEKELLNEANTGEEKET